jgi:hypothetical protein
MTMKEQYFTRAELYELVWSKPMQKLAEELGISDVGLSKVCTRNEIPTPPRGYWARVEAGQKVRRPPLLKPVGRISAKIKISGAMTGLPEPAREILAKSKAEKKIKDATPPVINADFDNLHPTLRATWKILRARKCEPDGAVHAVGEGLCGVIVGPESVQRVTLFLDALFKLLDKDGFNPEATGEAMRITQEKDHATFVVIERTKREKHEPSATEIAAEERRIRRRDQYFRDPNRSTFGEENLFIRAYPDHDTVYTGQLVFKIEGYWDPIRRSWGDGKTQTLESMLNDIAAGLKAFLALQKVRREEREEKERLRQALVARHDLSKKRKERDKNRQSFLQLVIEQQNEASHLRQCLSRLADAEADEGLVRFSNWVRERLQELDRLLGPAGLAEEIKRKGLFPAVDPFHDPLGEPPPLTAWW